nr:ATP-dependent sacrificial sulfur transferase LarE [Bacteroidota bacterium]
MIHQTEKKHKNLIHFLGRLNKVAIAFSGGVDSTFLVAAAKQALGENVVAFTVNAPHIPDWEVKEAKDWIKQSGVKHEIIKAEIPENIKNNPSNRCYLCKKQIFTILKSEAKKRGIQYLLEGTNKDDEGDYRPGMKALEELDVLSPLREVGLTKNEIRQLSKEFHLPTWNKLAYACLLTRIPYNTTVTTEELARIEKGEVYLFQLGYKGARLRSHGNIARIEFQQEHFDVLSDNKLRGEIVKKVKSVGYQFVCADIEGYRMGSFDQIKDESGLKSKR